eukprot:NODE_426_length_7665_cov_0.708961.p9 type:complete len:146 gc:universal NODE_426_length_7665_cov_0.708961:3988-3551(-)
MNLLFLIMLNAMAIIGYPNEKVNLNTLIEENRELCRDVSDITKNRNADSKPELPLWNLQSHVITTAGSICRKLEVVKSQNLHLKIHNLLITVSEKLLSLSGQDLNNLWHSLLSLYSSIRDLETDTSHTNYFNFGNKEPMFPMEVV